MNDYHRELSAAEWRMAWRTAIRIAAGVLILLLAIKFIWEVLP